MVLGAADGPNWWNCSTGTCVVVTGHRRLMPYSIREAGIVVSRRISTRLSELISKITDAVKTKITIVVEAKPPPIPMGAVPKILVSAAPVPAVVAGYVSLAMW